jgi:hypothetical protein
MLSILEAYGSTWPGSRGYVDDIGGKKEGEKEKEEKEGKEEKKEEGKKSERRGSQVLRNAAFSTEFGQVRCIITPGEDAMVIHSLFI